VRDELAGELERLGFDTVDDAAGVALESVANAVNSVES
jgi:hypothetical protein